MKILFSIKMIEEIFSKVSKLTFKGEQLGETPNLGEVIADFPQNDLFSICVDKDDLIVDYSDEFITEIVDLYLDFLKDLLPIVEEGMPLIEKVQPLIEKWTQKIGETSVKMSF